MFCLQGKTTISPTTARGHAGDQQLGHQMETKASLTTFCFCFARRPKENLVKTHPGNQKSLCQSTLISGSGLTELGIELGNLGIKLGKLSIELGKLGI